MTVEQISQVICYCGLSEFLLLKWFLPFSVVQ